MATNETQKGASDWPPRALMWFCILAVSLLAYLFRDALLRGYVLGQADFLFDYLPWQPYRPSSWRVRNPLMGDPPLVFYPSILHARTQILRGVFPLWASGIGGGQPFFAAMQTAVLSPFTMLHYLLPFPASLTVDAATRLFAGGLGMYVFLRRLPLSPGAAVFGGLAYLLNSFSVVWLEHPLAAVAAWLPWVLIAVDRCATGGVPNSIVVLAAVTAGMLLSGHPETAFKVLLFAGPFGVFRGWSGGTLVRSTLSITGGMSLGAVLTSIQLLPFLEYAGESRVLAVRAAAGTPLFTNSFISFVTAFVPDFYGTPLRRDFVIAGNYCEQQIYSSLMLWLLAPIAFVNSRHRRTALFFTSAAIIAVFIMYGTPVARLATWVIPPLRVAALSRFGLIVIASVAICAAVGLDALVGEERSARAPVIGAIAAVAIALVVLGYLVEQRAFLTAARHWSATLRSTWQSAVFLVAAVALIVTARRLGPRLALAALSGLLAINLQWFAAGFHSPMPPELSFPQTPETSLIAADTGLFRVAGWMNTLPANTAMVYGLRDVRSYDGVGIRNYFDLLDVSFHFTGLTHQLVNVAYPRFLDLLNVKYVVAPHEIDLPVDRFTLLLDGPSRVYRNERVQPRAFLVDGHVVLQGNDARRAMRDTLDLTRVAVLDTPLPASAQPEAATGDIGRATMLRYEDNRIAITTRAEGRRLLVLTDAYYPGWTATLDGQQVPIARADYAFRAVSVPAGQHLVEFRYEPASFRYGALGSVCGVLVALLMLTTSMLSARIRVRPPPL